MSQLMEYIKLALMNIKSNKVRTFLTMLGIIIGVSSVILIISIGNGVKTQVNGTLNDIAGGQIYVYSENTEDEEALTFSIEDCRAIEEKVNGVVGVSMKWGSWVQAEGPKGQFDCQISGGTESLQYNYKEPLLYGRYFTREEFEAGKRVCVIKEKSAVALFGTANVVGLTFEIESREFLIVGVRKDNESAMYNMLADMGDTIEVEMPVTNICELYGIDDMTFDGFYIFSDMIVDTKEIVSQTVAVLEARHNCRGEKRIKVEDFNTYMDEINSIVDMLKLFVVFVAAISLLVGGIGVMTIMLVSVTERTREIGIRKSLGARTGSIMIQFLCESAIITLIAGLIGIVVGALGANLIGGIIGFDAEVDIVTVLGASLFSSFVGLFFGIYPAKKAAKLSPIEALRHE